MTKHIPSFDTADARQIWVSLKNGNDSALKSLYELYHKSLYNYGAKFTADKELIKDCIQELFVTIWTRRDKLSTPKDIRNYLFKAFRHSIFKRNAAALQNLSYQETEDYTFEVTISVEDAIITAEHTAGIAAKLQSVISRLTPRQQEVIFLKFNETMSYEEIAIIMGITTKASYKLMARSLDFLRQHLSKDELFILFSILHYKLFH